MVTDELSKVVGRVRTILEKQGIRDASDADLLKRYLRDGDEAAFATLVRRHGPMVLSVCRRVLRNHADAQDAFQATFLILVRKAASLRSPGLLANWLYGVAYRTAQHAKRTAAIRRRRETSMPSRTEPVEEMSNELLAALDLELERLPQKYRAVVVLCDLEGKTRKESAKQLGWPEGTVAGRLARGRSLLTKRLARHGVVLTGAAIAEQLAQSAGASIVSTALLAHTVKAASFYGSKQAAFGVISTTAIQLAEGVLKTMLLTKLKIVTGVVFIATLVAGLGTGMAGSYLASAEQPGQNKTTEKANPAVKGQEAAQTAPQRQATDVGKLLNRLEQLQPQAGQDEWASALRDLIQLGPPAVPELIAEMDATHDSFMLRCLAFALRGIGDKRAIPGLIRALPKTCIPPGSDMGYSFKDPDLLAFMQKHEGNPSFDKSHYTFGRPVNEVKFTLQEMTGQKMGEDELVNIFLTGRPRQRFLKQSLYQRCAERWAKWWELHHAEYVKDAHYAKVNLLPLADDSSSDQDFPHGPAVTIADNFSGHILESVRNPRAKFVFLDLDTGRQSGLPKHLQGAERQPERMDNFLALASVFVPLGGLQRSEPERLDDILAWAAREGFDLMGTEYTVPGDDTPHYMLRGLGLAAWQIDTDRWDGLETELLNAKPLDMGTRTDGLLANFEAAKGRYEPEDTAAFLYKTREGSYGAIFVGVEVRDTNMQGEIGRPVRAGINLNLNPKGFYKGRRFGYLTIAQPAAK